MDIEGHRFDVNLEDEFALYLEAQMAKDFNMDAKNDLKILLQAYVRKNHELFTQELQMNELLKTLEI